MTKRLTAEELSAIKERAEKATEGPWYVDSSSVKTKHPEHQSLSHWYGGTNNEVCSLSDGGEYIDNMNEDNDVEFIANARQDIPKLLAEVERLKHYEEKCGKLLEALRYMPCDIDDIVGGDA